MITETGVSVGCGRCAVFTEQSVIIVADRENNYEYSTEENRIMCDKSVKIGHGDNIFLHDLYAMYSYSVCDFRDYFILRIKIYCPNWPELTIGGAIL